MDAQEDGDAVVAVGHVHGHALLQTHNPAGNVSGVSTFIPLTPNPVRRPYQEHAESFSHDAVEEVEARVSRHHEEVAQEEELSAAVVQQSVVLTAEQSLVGILRETHIRQRQLHLPSLSTGWRRSSHPAVSALRRVRHQDGPLQLSGTQDSSPLAQREDGVPALQGRFGEETCSVKSRNSESM